MKDNRYRQVAIEQVEDSIMDRIMAVREGLDQSLDLLEAAEAEMLRHGDPVYLTNASRDARQDAMSDLRMIDERVKQATSSAQFRREFKMARLLGENGVKMALRRMLRDVLKHHDDMDGRPSLQGVLSRMDRDYFHLRRDTMNLRRQRDEYARTAPEDDAMLEVMDWQLESAASAEDTRFLELKTDMALMEKVLEQLRLDEEHYAIVAEKRAKLVRERAKMLQEYEDMMRLRREIARKKSNGWLFIMMMWFMSVQHWVEMERQRLHHEREDEKRVQARAGLAFAPAA